MTVAFDAFNALSTGTGTQSVSHAPVGTPRGVLIFVVETGGLTTEIDAVTYGGVALSYVDSLTYDSAVDRVISVYFLGSSVPTGTQTAQVTYTGTGTIRRSYVYTLTGADDLEAFVTSAKTGEAGASASRTMGLSSRNSFVALACGVSTSAVGNFGPSAGWADREEHDLGSHCVATYSYNTIGSTDVTVSHGVNSQAFASLGVGGRVGPCRYT